MSNEGVMECAEGLVKLQKANKRKFNSEAYKCAKIKRNEMIHNATHTLVIAYKNLKTGTMTLKCRRRTFSVMNLQRPGVMCGYKLQCKYDFGTESFGDFTELAPHSHSTAARLNWTPQMTSLLKFLRDKSNLGWNDIVSSMNKAYPGNNFTKWKVSTHYLKGKPMGLSKRSFGIWLSKECNTCSEAYTKLMETVSSNSTREIVVNTHTLTYALSRSTYIPLTYHDFKAFSGTYWMGDNIINVWFNKLNNLSQNNHDIFVSTQFIQSLQSGDKDHGTLLRHYFTSKFGSSWRQAFIPVHEAAHWWLAVIDRRTSSLEVVDSKPWTIGDVENRETEKQLLEFLNSSIDVQKNPTWAIVNSGGKQEDSHTCGTFVCAAAACRLFKVKDSEQRVTQTSVNCFRSWLGWFLYSTGNPS